MPLTEIVFGHLNLFRVLGDGLHVVSILLLFLKMWRQKRCTGISLKTQQLYCAVFVTRYLDLFTSFISVYNELMKVLFLVTSFATVYYMRTKLYSSYQANEESDSLDVKYLIIFCATLSLIFNHGYSPLELLWVFSIYLEAVAIFPQLYMLRKTKEIENLTGHYMVCLGAYRMMYIANWIYRYVYDPNYGTQWIIWLSGVVQTVLYADFFYYYVKSKLHGHSMPVVLPA